MSPISIGKTASRLLTILLSSVVLLICCQHAAADTLLIAGVDGNGLIGAFNPTTGAFEGVFSSTFTRGIATASNGNILAADNNMIDQISPNGTTLSPFAALNGLGLKVAVGSDGSVYSLTQNNAGQTEVDKFSANGTSLGTVVQPTSYYFDVAIAGNGDIITDGNGGIQTRNASGQVIASENITGLSFDAMVSGNDVYVSTGGTEYGNGSFAGLIYKCTGCATGAGTVSLFGTDPNHGNLQEMIHGPNGEILVADRDSSHILAFSASGTYLGIFSTTYNIQTNVGAFGPYSMTYLADSSNQSGAVPEPMTIATFAAGLAGLARKLGRKK